MALQTLVNLDDVEQAGRAKMIKMYADFYAGGAEDNASLRRNRAAFAEIHFVPPVLINVRLRSLSHTILGQPVAFPFGIAPTAQHRLAHVDGELATARAAAATNTLYCLSTMSTCSIEDVSAEFSSSMSPRWSA